jgi:hypothetical protein
MTPPWLIEYKRAHWAYVRATYPALPGKAIPRIATPKLTANSITSAIINYCKWRGWHAERVNVMGRQIYDKRRGKTIWIKTSGRRGSADIHAIIDGKPVMIEVKAGKDRMSTAQVNYALSVQLAGGVYLVVRSFEDFYNYLKTKNLLP